MYAHDDFDADHSTSPTGHVIEALELYGYRPAEDEADPRITPEDDVIRTAVADIFDALISTMADTSLDFDLDEILWSTVNTFHRAVERVERTLDDNEQAQKQGQREQDGFPRKINVGRLIKPDEIADAICFMLTNSAVSGELWVDAGWHAPA